ncbi:hypothetical protein HDU92_007901, partial [Lobulomyces angularis]
MLSSDKINEEVPQPQAKLIKSNPLASKLQTVLSTSFDDPLTQSALASLNEFYKENSVLERRNLRGNVEARSLE